MINEWEMVKVDWIGFGRVFYDFDEVMFFLFVILG